jgi:hypothetical protein
MDNGDKLSMQLGDNEALYAIAASGTPTLYVMDTIN